MDHQHAPQQQQQQQQTKDEWEILKDVYSMLLNGKVLNTPTEEPIVRFKYPEELRVSILLYNIFFFIL